MLPDVELQIGATAIAGEDAAFPFVDPLSCMLGVGLIGEVKVGGIEVWNGGRLRRHGPDLSAIDPVVDRWREEWGAERVERGCGEGLGRGPRIGAPLWRSCEKQTTILGGAPLPFGGGIRHHAGWEVVRPGERGGRAGERGGIGNRGKGLSGDGDWVGMGTGGAMAWETERGRWCGSRSSS